MSTRIAHANVRVADPAASVGFYRALGLELTGCLHIEEGYYLLYMSTPEAPDLTLELAVNENAGPDYSRAPGTGHLALAVGDLDELLARLSADGVASGIEPFHPVAGRDLRVGFATDPDGNKVELIEGTFPTPSDPIPAALTS